MIRLMSRHHELCFGCGRVNPFGLLMEVEQASPGSVTGRWFAKQDHQGPLRGNVHPGLVVCALLEAVMLAAGEGAEVTEMAMAFEPDPAVGVGRFCEVTAQVAGAVNGASTADATASVDDRVVARLHAQLAVPQKCD